MTQSIQNKMMLKSKTSVTFTIMELRKVKYVTIHTLVWARVPV
jgi:hypothetical protein